MYCSCNHSLNFSVKFTLNPTDPLHLSGGDLPLTYEFQHLTFHWGPDDTKGCEHTIDGKSFPLEMQVVHTRLTEKPKTDQFVIVSYFFKVTIFKTLYLYTCTQDSIFEISGSEKK